MFTQLIVCVGLGLTEFPQNLANALGLPGAAGLFAAQLIASSMILMMLLLPVLFLSQNPLVAVIVGIVALGIDVGLTWLPAWMFIVTLILIAALMSGVMRDWLSGRGGGS